MIKQLYFSLLIDLENLKRKLTKIDLINIVNIIIYNEWSIFISNILKVLNKMQNRLKNIAKLLKSKNQKK